MKKQELKFNFHNPNTPEIIADYIVKIFVEANQKKIKQVMITNAPDNQNTNNMSYSINA